ncbi:hypothetical protein tooticki91_gp029 [Flavobacterium phage vB_FspS_tooticki9-1]|uniref:Uncharacterized protein n=11 Tax=Muminvirus TaxID=2843426 RepID=A0A6B9LGC0_9CAUD|nr:hypothetical protein HWC93_gp31 [Flavobacterium phage vB_FspS_mumin9-1]YP_009855100.1 hypothetical protein HWC94_gp32 [Flavobacterium phage vB_FspS_mymlan6-1]YP_009855515.1 hypothetical protein HWD00_gp29 [Flavobacterium phage vB_FspS_tooticki6-1]QHB39638.1 hypothetical protein mumin61_gp031 [Flavobacterium phage vB_FspS_mumin6-1]QHB39705.1 hypothetical protein mumin62_gp031 [Flavobacterium phage vB_FspS_mumin6-2]QHB39771.1 hypothetical protein mumin63_gp030 [Flavobacterium phage vB_FspS_mu
MTLRDKTPEQRKEQLIRIINLLIERGQNNEKINDEYKKLLKNSIN